jgi:organic radical activating enzyme
MRDKKNVYIETNGTKLPDMDRECFRYVVFNISPKLSNSGMLDTVNTVVISELMKNYGYQFKFVVNTIADMGEAASFCENTEIKENIVLQPNGRLLTDTAQMQKLWEDFLTVVRAHPKLDMRWIPQQHVYVFGNKRGV